MKHCRKCGKENKDSVYFCTTCGEVLPLAKKLLDTQE